MLGLLSRLYYVSSQIPKVDHTKPHLFADFQPTKVHRSGRLSYQAAQIRLFGCSKNHTRSTRQSISYPDVYLYAIAARDKVRAEAFATKYGFQKAYGGPTGYQGRDSAIYLSLLQLLNVLQT